MNISNIAQNSIAQTKTSGLHKKIVDIVANNIGCLPENDEETIILDKLDEIEIIMDLEEEFSINISDDEFKNCNTVNKIMQFLLSKLY